MVAFVKQMREKKERGIKEREDMSLVKGLELGSDRLFAWATVVGTQSQMAWLCPGLLCGGRNTDISGEFWVHFSLSCLN